MSDIPTHYRANCAFWRKCETIKAWEIAYLMLGYEPRLADSITERDPDHPDDPIGVLPDISEELRFLLGAVHTQTLAAVGNTPTHEERTEITRESLIPWLAEIGYGTLAADLQRATAPISQPTSDAVVAPEAAGVRPVSIGNWRKQTILSTIEQLGFDPLALPKNPPGKPGVKAAVRAKLKAHPCWVSVKAFNNSWQALRALKEIQEAT